MKLYEWLFGSASENRDRRAEYAERKHSIAMDGRGGAELAPDHVESETEKELREATSEKPR